MIHITTLQIYKKPIYKFVNWNTNMYSYRKLYSILSEVVLLWYDGFYFNYGVYTTVIIYEIFC